MKKIALIAALVMLFTCISPAAFAETTVDTILTAGTTQAFTDEDVPEEDIETILRAGLASESAINQQPWFFVAVTDKAVMEELAASGGMPPMGGAMPPAPNGQIPDGLAPDGGAPAGDRIHVRRFHPCRHGSGGGPDRQGASDVRQSGRDAGGAAALRLRRRHPRSRPAFPAA